MPTDRASTREKWNGPTPRDVCERSQLDGPIKVGNYIVSLSRSTMVLPDLPRVPLSNSEM
jgi:hypothetical protein